MKNKKVFSTRHIITDCVSGEILSDKSSATYVNSQSESFSMVTTTNGLEWAKPFRGYLLFLMVLNQYADVDGHLFLSPSRRAAVKKFFKWTNDRTFGSAINHLIDNDGIKRTSQYDFYINPDTFFKGSTINKRAKQELYNSI